MNQCISKSSVITIYLEYLAMDLEETCFNFLIDFIMNPKKRGAWTMVFEQIMVCYLIRLNLSILVLI
jgi:hypothetical protein